MKTISRRKIEIQWGDCDPAQIVHFPRYFTYFDACTTALFKKVGLSKRKMLKTYQIVGIPLVDVRATFMVPSRFSDTVTVESEITEWRRSSFCIRHRLFNRKVLAVECGAKKIRVNAILPGGTDTAMNTTRAPDAPAGAQAFIEGLHALKRIASPEEIAQSVLYLASDASTFVTGSALLIDGGVSVNRT